MRFYLETNSEEWRAAGRAWQEHEKIRRLESTSVEFRPLHQAMEAMKNEAVKLITHKNRLRLQFEHVPEEAAANHPVQFEALRARLTAAEQDVEQMKAVLKEAEEDLRTRTIEGQRQRAEAELSEVPTNLREEALRIRKQWRSERNDVKELDRVTWGVHIFRRREIFMLEYMIEWYRAHENAEQADRLANHLAILRSEFAPVAAEHEKHLSRLTEIDALYAAEIKRLCSANIANPAATSDPAISRNAPSNDL